MDIVFQAVVALAFPFFSRRLPVCLGSRRHRFFLRFCLSDRELLQFCQRRNPNSSPVSVQWCTHHSTEITFAAIPKSVVLIFYSFSVQKMPVSTFLQFWIGEKHPGGRSRESDYLSHETADRIELTSHWFHFWKFRLVLPLPSTNTSPIQNQWAIGKREKHREKERERERERERETR